MPPASVTSRLAAAAAPGFVLERSEAVPALIGRHQDFLFIAGLGGTACDVGAVTGDGAHVYSLGGAMGAACMMGLGLALARPDKRVLVVTGDGELLMNLGALAAIAVIDPPNLAILCVDNGHYGETGWQKSHTSLGVDLEKIARRLRHQAHAHRCRRRGYRRRRAPIARRQRHRLRAAAGQTHRAGRVQAQFRCVAVARSLPRGAAIEVVVWSAVIPGRREASRPESIITACDYGFRGSLATHPSRLLPTWALKCRSRLNPRSVAPE